jgi:CheY-like chemotaxis protein
MTPLILLVHAGDDARSRARAAFAGLPVELRAERDTAAAEACLATGGRIAVLVTDVSQARWAVGALGALRSDPGTLPALAVFATFQAEPQAFQAGAVVMLTHPLAPSEAQALAALAGHPESLGPLCAAVAGTKSLDALTKLIASESGPALAWAQYHAAAVLLAEGKLQEALEDLSALVDEQPAFWRAHERLAGIWDIAGDPEVATRHRGIADSIRERLARESDAALAAHPPAAEPAPAPDAPPVAPLADAPPLPRAPEADIIVADDSELVREMLADVLQRAGFSVRLATDGQQALDLARAQRPDALILDGLMPGKTGFDACKEIKDVLYPGNPPKVLIFSAIYTKLRQRNEAVSLYKVDEVLAKPTDKPLDEDELLAALRRHLGR